MRHLVLWDIDGTLITSRGAGLRAFQVALRREFGIEDTLAGIEAAGRTDQWIMRQVFRKLDLEESAENFERLFDRYIEALPAELARREARVLPGAREILAAAERRGDIAQGLLTGNMRRGAEVKLTHHRLWQHFHFGAFGDDSENRDELGPHAVRRALERHGVNFDADKIWVVGDTPHDIACGNCIGARTLALATGTFAFERLRAHRPTAVLENLADTDAVMRLITG